MLFVTTDVLDGLSKALPLPLLACAGLAYLVVDNNSKEDEEKWTQHMRLYLENIACRAVVSVGVFRVATAFTAGVEGILVLAEQSVRDRFELKVYIDTEADLRFIRRLIRDVAERGRTPDSIIAQYLESVRPAHEQFIEPSKRFADVIIPHGGLNAPAIDVLLARVRELTISQ